MTRKIVSLDVREMLRKKEEPFQLIMSTVNELGGQDVLELHATFRPDPLLRVLGKQGFQHAVLQEDSDHYIVQFYRNVEDRPYFHIDNRGLEPPEPMVRTLDYLEHREEFRNGSLGLEIWNERVPAFLLPELESLNFLYDIDDREEDNGIVRVRIYKVE